MKWVFLMMAVYVLSKPSKEEACLLISDYSKIYKKHELHQFLERNSWADKRKVMKKMGEDLFYYCLDRITEKEAFGINVERMPEMAKVQHLLGVELYYKNEQDLQVSQEFTDKHKKLRKVWADKFVGNDL